MTCKSSIVFGVFVEAMIQTEYEDEAIQESVLPLPELQLSIRVIATEIVVVVVRGGQSWGRWSEKQLRRRQCGEVSSHSLFIGYSIVVHTRSIAPSFSSGYQMNKSLKSQII